MRPSNVRAESHGNYLTMYFNVEPITEEIYPSLGLPLSMMMKLSQPPPVGRPARLLRVLYVSDMRGYADLTIPPGCILCKAFGT